MVLAGAWVVLGVETVGDGLDFGDWPDLSVQWLTVYIAAPGVLRHVTGTLVGVVGTSTDCFYFYS